MFDDGLSQLIIENDNNMKNLEKMQQNLLVLPSVNPPVKPIRFINKPISNIINSPIAFINN